MHAHKLVQKLRNTELPTGKKDIKHENHISCLSILHCKDISKDDGKTYLVSTHGCALRAMLNFMYEYPGDYWHGHVPYNCCVNVIEVKNGVATLIADDLIYYDQDMAIDRYKE